MAPALRKDISMNFKLQLIIALLILTGLGILINLIRKNKLDLKYALSWILLGAGILVFDLFPGLTSLIAALLGVDVPVNALFFLGFCFSLLVIFSLTVAVSRLSRRVTRLTQELALLDRRLKEYEKGAQRRNQTLRETRTEPMERRFHYFLTKEQEGATVSEYLRSLGYSRGILLRLKRTPRGILRNGEPVYGSTRLQSGDRLDILLREDASSENIPATPMDLSILYEDEDLLVLNKPADLPIHPSLGNYENTLANGVAYYYQSRGQNFVYRCINRLTGTPPEP